MRWHLKRNLLTFGTDLIFLQITSYLELWPPSITMCSWVIAALYLVTLLFRIEDDAHMAVRFAVTTTSVVSARCQGHMMVFVIVVTAVFPFYISSFVCVFERVSVISSRRRDIYNRFELKNEHVRPWKQHLKMMAFYGYKISSSSLRLVPFVHCVLPLLH